MMTDRRPPRTAPPAPSDRFWSRLRSMLGVDKPAVVED
jgi:hypothetical protein